MTDDRGGESKTKPTSNSVGADSGRGERQAVKSKSQGKGVQATGGDKGSKKTNDFERSGLDRNAGQGRQSPENKGRVGVDNEKVSRRGDTEKTTRGTEKKVAAKGNANPRRERITEAAVDVDEKDKPRKTSKGERGSRKPGTELTKEEQTARKS